MEKNKQDGQRYRLVHNWGRDLVDGTTLVEGDCALTGRSWSCRVDTAGLRRWLGGELAQRALPTATPEEREFLISGITPEGWKEAFGD